MIDTHLQLRPFDLALRPDRYDRKINVTIGKISCRAEAVNDLQAERRGVKLNQLLHVLGENREMTDASHRFSPLRPTCSWPASYEICTAPDKRNRRANPQQIIGDKS